MDPEQDSAPDRKGISRKRFVVGGAAAGAALGLGGFATPKAAGAPDPPPRDDEELVLYNGRIHTMDGDNRVVSGVVIRNGRFVEVDKGVTQARHEPSTCGAARSSPASSSRTSTS